MDFWLKARSEGDSLLILLIFIQPGNKECQINVKCYLSQIATMQENSLKC
jgi:hypothetical protein